MTKKSNLKKQEKDYLATGELLEFDAENYLESTACEEIDYPDDEQEAIEESAEWAREEELIRSEAIKQVSQFEISKLIFTSEFLSACKLTPTTKLVLLGLCNYYNPKNAAFFPSQKTLARIAGVCDRSAERAISELTKKGLITYTTKIVNRYQFTPKFFSLIKLADYTEQHEEMLKKREEKRAAAVRRKEKSYYQKQEPPTSRRVPNSEETQKLLEQMRKDREQACSPLDFPEKRAIKWFYRNNRRMRNRGFARKVGLKYSLNPELVFPLEMDEDTLYSMLKPEDMSCPYYKRFADVTDEEFEIKTREYEAEQRRKMLEEERKKLEEEQRPQQQVTEGKQITEQLSVPQQLDLEAVISSLVNNTGTKLAKEEKKQKRKNKKKRRDSDDKNINPIEVTVPCVLTNTNSYTNKGLLSSNLPKSLILERAITEQTLREMAHGRSTFVF